MGGGGTNRAINLIEHPLGLGDSGSPKLIEMNVATNFGYYVKAG